MIDIKGPSQLQDLSDVQVTTLTSDDVMQFDGTDFINVTPAVLAGTLSHTDLQDIGTNAHTVIDSHIADISSNPHQVSLTGLTDTNITALATGMILTWSGSLWSNAFLSSIADADYARLDAANTPFTAQIEAPSIRFDAAATLTIVGNGNDLELNADDAANGVVKIGSFFQTDHSSTIINTPAAEFLAEFSPAAGGRSQGFHLHTTYKPTSSGLTGVGIEAHTVKDTAQNMTAMTPVLAQLEWEDSAQLNTVIAASLFAASPIFGTSLTGTLTNIFGAYIQDHGSSNATNVYGLEINDQTSATNNYSFRSQGGIGLHAGSMHVGATTDPTITGHEITGDLKQSGEHKGARIMLGAGNNTNQTASGYLKGYNGVQHTATKGWTMPRDGSIVELSMNFEVDSVSTPGNLNCQIRKNGTNVFSRALNITTAGVKNIWNFQNRDTDTFVQGDVITIYVDFTVFAGQIDDVTATFGVYFDD